jgi:hypothetical protein
MTTFSAGWVVNVGVGGTCVSVGVEIGATTVRVGVEVGGTTVGVGVEVGGIAVEQLSQHLRTLFHIGRGDFLPLGCNGTWARIELADV